MELEIIDMFPHDHPLLNIEDETNVQAMQMSQSLNDIVKNIYMGERIHAYAFVFDASNRNTFETLFTLVDTIKEIEKSARKGKRTLIYESKKICIGNKKDLKKTK